MIGKDKTPRHLHVGRLDILLDFDIVHQAHVEHVEQIKG